MNKSNGKFIISGEHSVVYGEPAIVSELDKTISVEIINLDIERELSEYEKFIFNLFTQKYKQNTSGLTVKAKSNLPQKSGLGTSAAFAHAVLKGLSNYFKIKITKEEMFKLVYDSEVFIHQNPSGIDPFAVVYGGCHLFKKNLVTHKFENKKIVLYRKYNFLLINSGEATESTGEMVSLVKKFLKEDTSNKKIIKNIGKITNKIKQQLTEGTFIGDLFEENQNELDKLNIVGKKAKNIIEEVKKVGSYAKITGAGGVKSGSGWILVYDKNLNKTIKLCNLNNWEYIKTKVE